MTTSIIIPTHNRQSILRKTLDSLAGQTYPAAQLEVIVVLDGCSDDTHEMLRSYSAPFSLRIIEQDHRGPGAARNLGAQLAKGELLIFLDDDIEAAPGFVQAHVNAHQNISHKVVIGYSHPNLAGQRSYLSLELQSWWEAMFQLMQQPGYRFRYNDMLSGNFSISRDFFTQIGGFNTHLSVHEDYELGMRLILAGAMFAFEVAALGIHHEQSDMQRILNRKFQEGIADIRLGRMYPELISTLLAWRLWRYSLPPSRLLNYLGFTLPRLANGIAAIMMKALPQLETARMLGTWRRVLYGLLGYWYWKGVAQELKTLREVKDFLASAPDPTLTRKGAELVIDLSQGLEQAEQILDEARPVSAKICYGNQFIGCMYPEPGAERWHGGHLRPYLLGGSLIPLFEALASQGVIQLPLNIEEIPFFQKTEKLSLAQQEQSCDSL
mgnify:CR=1 FL=1